MGVSHTVGLADDVAAERHEADTAVSTDGHALRPVLKTHTVPLREEWMIMDDQYFSFETQRTGSQRGSGTSVTS